MTDSNRLAITEFATGSDGVATGNEMIAKLEAGAGRWCCVQVNLNTPPGSPAEGDMYIVGTTATGVWVGQETNKAIYHNAAWLIVPPIEGDLAYDQTSNDDYQFNGTAWVLWNLTGSGSSGALTPFARGTISTGTETPEPGDGAMQTATNGGAHTLAAPTTTGTYVLTYSNNASAGAITATGWDSIADAGSVLAHTVENSVIECAAYNDGVSKRLIVTLIEDATP